MSIPDNMHSNKLNSVTPINTKGLKPLTKIEQRVARVTAQIKPNILRLPPLNRLSKHVEPINAKMDEFEFALDILLDRMTLKF